MLTGPDLGAAIDAARIKKGLTKKALADHFGVKPPSIQDWIKRGTVDKQHLQGLWLLFSDVAGPAHWGLDEIRGESLATLSAATGSATGTAHPLGVGVAHLTTLDAPTVPPLTWEELTMPLSTVFRVVLPDDALAPELRAGDWIEVSTEVTAAPGDWVLVRDAGGLFYAREFRQRRPGDWTAASSHVGFEPMDAATYGLTVVGTVTAWGSSRRRSAR